MCEMKQARAMLGGNCARNVTSGGPSTKGMDGVAECS